MMNRNNRYKRAQGVVSFLHRLPTYCKGDHRAKRADQVNRRGRVLCVVSRTDAPLRYQSLTDFVRPTVAGRS